MNQKKEKEIIKLILKGNRDSYTFLVDRYKGPIFNLAYRMTGNDQDADDLAQETFVKAYEALKRFNLKKRFYPWLYTIALNLIRNHLKRRKASFTENADRIAPDQWDRDLNNPEKVMVSDQKTERLAFYLQKLPLGLREALVLRFYQDLPFEDIADILDISLSSAKMRVYRGLEKLRFFFEGDS